jgi:DNA topoisomerase-1
VELIVTEKEIAARRIAAILSGDSAEVERRNGVNVYRWGGRRCVGLSGHVVEVDFPSEYEGWRDVEPRELVDASVEKHPTRENIVRTLRLLARQADRVTIATDYDREGELIGKEAYKLVQEVTDAPVDRVRFSSITDREVTEAFAEPDGIDFDLAAAGEARQVIDLVWGAALTRFLSLSAKRFGGDFISVGRVQSPTLKLIVDREREIEAFDPQDYWELFADLDAAGERFEAQYFYDDNGSEADRVWEKERASAIHEAIEKSETALAQSVQRRQRTDSPPVPFSTTKFISAASSLGLSAERAMSVAEDLYTEGYITYPRTDNTVYPDDLAVADLLAELSSHREFAEDARALAENGGGLDPTEGENETTDHPPIHPTGELPDPGGLGDAEARVYELVVRRFFATVADAATWERLRVVAGIEATDDEDTERENGDRHDHDHRLKANGKRLLEPGYHAVYPYSNASENHVPDVEEDDVLSVEDARIEAKETQPPRRYGQSRLIERMEAMGIGTKATRHSVLEKLYDRGYVENDPPRPTQLARGVVDAAESFAEQIVDEGMTSELEADMAAIARGEATLAEVTDESREMLGRVFAKLTDSRDAIGDRLRSSLKVDKTLGPCPDCGSELLVRRSRQGSHFVGCGGYPDCEYTLPLPNGGTPQLLDEQCKDHDLRYVKVLAGRGTFVHGCPQCEADAADDAADRIIGACPECGTSKGGELAIKRLRSGSRLVGCARYPDCEYSLPLPRRGEIEVTEEYCGEHDLPELVVENGEEPWELGCPICNFQEYEARQRAAALTDLDGVGEKTAAKLEAAGVETVADLSTIEADSLATDVEGVSADRIREWQSRESAGGSAAD